MARLVGEHRLWIAGAFKLLTGCEMEDDVVQRIARLSVVTPTARIVGKESALCLSAVVRFGACMDFRARVGDFVADAVLGDLSVAFCGEVVPPMRMDASVFAPSECGRNDCCKVRVRVDVLCPACKFAVCPRVHACRRRALFRHWPDCPLLTAWSGI